MPVQTGIVAGASSFMLGEEQYIAVVAGNAPVGGYYAPNYSRLLVFKLGGKLTLPPAQEFTQRPLAPPESTASAELIAAGGELYGENCILCHSDSTISRGTFPDLLRTPLLYSQEGFDEVVLGGILSEQGMASFNEVLGSEDTQAIHAYLIEQANIQLLQDAQRTINAGAPTGDNEIQNE